MTCVPFQAKEKEDRDRLLLKEMKLRDKLVTTYKVFEEKKMEEQREKLRRAIEGKKKVMTSCFPHISSLQHIRY